MMRAELGRIASGLVVACAVVMLLACQSAGEVKKEQVVTYDAPQGSDKVLDEAKAMLRLDDYQAFEKAEFRFLALRFWRKEDVQIAGWLAQLYVAWAEQLRSEIDFLRLKSAASHAMEKRGDWNAISALIDYRLAKLAEVEEQARQTCNMLVTYHSQDYISHRVMADYYRLMQDREKTQDQLMILRSQNPESVGLAFLEGAVRSQFDKDDMAALAFYDKALAADPKFTKALYFKGLAYHNMGDAARAQAAMRAVLEISPAHPGARAYLAAADYLAQLSEEARRKLTIAQAAPADASGVPKLIYWVGQWVEGEPRLSWRLAGAAGADSEVRMTLSLVENGDTVVATAEKTISIKANGFLGGTELVKLEKRKRDAAYHFIVHLAARTPQSGEYATISIQKAELPDSP